MKPKVILLAALLPYAIPLIISIGAVVGIIPLSPGTSPRLPIILAFGCAFLLSVVIWKWRSPEIQASLRELNTTHEVEKSNARSLVLVKSLMVTLFAVLGIGAGAFVLFAGQVERQGGLLVVLGLLAMLLSITAFAYLKKFNSMAVQSRQDKASHSSNTD